MKLCVALVLVVLALVAIGVLFGWPPAAQGERALGPSGAGNGIAEGDTEHAGSTDPAPEPVQRDAIESSTAPESREEEAVDDDRPDVAQRASGGLSAIEEARVLGQLVDIRSGLIANLEQVAPDPSSSEQEYLARGSAMADALASIETRHAAIDLLRKGRYLVVQENEDVPLGSGVRDLHLRRVLLDGGERVRIVFRVQYDEYPDVARLTDRQHGAYMAARRSCVLEFNGLPIERRRVLAGRIHQVRDLGARLASASAAEVEVLRREVDSAVATVSDWPSELVVDGETLLAR
jgi:hypothetical protein